MRTSLLFLVLLLVCFSCSEKAPEIRFCYPEGRMKALILSYDDGTIEDVELTALFDRTGVVGTFNLNSGYIDSVRGWPQENDDTIWQAYITKADLGRMYAGHEIAAHGTYHKDFITVSLDEVQQEVETDKANLEAWTGRSIRSLAYPFGNTNRAVAELVGEHGITNARTVKDTHGYGLPDDPLRWHPTCHDSKVMQHLDTYLELAPEEPTLFYVWGHSWEFKDQARWDNMVQFCERIGKQQDIWYTGCGDFIAYLEAMDRVKREEDHLVNPPDNAPVWVLGAEGPMVLQPGSRLPLADL